MADRNIANSDIPIIEVYRANIANPGDLEEAIFWVKSELRRIQSSSSSIEEVLRQIADQVYDEDGNPIPPGGGATGPQGPAGPAGPAGADGADGADGEVGDLISDSEVIFEKTWSSARITSYIAAELLAYLKQVFDDKSPELGSDLDGKREEIHSVKRLRVIGELSPQLFLADSFVEIGEDKTIDVAGATIPSGVRFLGTYTLPQGTNVFGAGFLFNAIALLDYTGGSASAFSGLNAQVTFRANGVVVTAVVPQRDYISQPTFSTTNGGTLTMSHLGYVSTASVTPGATLELKTGFRAQRWTGNVFFPTLFGVVDKEVHFDAAGNFGNGAWTTPETIFFIAGSSDGGISVNGDWNFYGEEEFPNRQGGGFVDKVTSNAAVNYTATLADSVILCSNAAAQTVLMPTAATIPATYVALPVGLTYTVKQNGAGAVTVNGNGANIDGAGTYAIPAQYNGVKVCWDGSTWNIIGVF